MRRFIVHLLGLGQLAVLLAGCFRAPTAPLASIDIHRKGPDQSRGLVVLLPGIFDGPADFTEEHFDEHVRAQANGYDVTAVDAHFGYYRSRTIIDRLHDDVIAPAERHGTPRSGWWGSPSAASARSCTRKPTPRCSTAS